jgi:hypothetical protein
MWLTVSLIGLVLYCFLWEREADARAWRQARREEREVAALRRKRI